MAEATAPRRAGGRTRVQRDRLGPDRPVSTRSASSSRANRSPTDPNGYPNAVELLLEPPGADPQVEPAAADPVDGGGHLRQERGMAERSGQHQPAQPRSLGHGGEPGERRHRFERGDRRGLHAVPRERVEEVIRHPDRIEPQRLGASGDVRHRIERDGLGVREREPVVRQASPKRMRGGYDAVAAARRYGDGVVIDGRRRHAAPQHDRAVRSRTSIPRVAGEIQIEPPERDRIAPGVHRRIRRRAALAALGRRKTRNGSALASARTEPVDHHDRDVGRAR